MLRRLDAWLQPPAEAKGGVGAWRDASMVGGRLLVTGSDDDTVDVFGTATNRSTPYGLHVVDTTSWQERTFGPHERWATIDGSIILGASGGPTGIVAYAPDGRRLYATLGGRTIDWVTSLGPRFEAVTGTYPHLVRWIVDAATGRVLHRDGSDWNYLIPLP
jgi:hypothetical protein